MSRCKDDELQKLSNEKKLNIIDEVAKEFYLKNELHDIDKARSIIKISKIICNTKVAKRDFSFVKNYGEVITNNDVDYGIRACKIKDIDDFVYLGWNRIRKIVENTIKYETISLKEVTKEYGDLKNDVNLNTYLIHTKLKINKININKKYITVEVENGLLLRHLNRTAIQHLKKSGNKTETFKYVQWNCLSNFGAFIDIGVHKDGLVHISEMSDHRIGTPHEVVKLHQHVRVRVLDIDLPRQRIQLSLKIKG